MTIKLKTVDVVTVGVGWAGSLLAKELAQAGLKVVGLERGGPRSQEQFQLPEMHDQLKYDRHLELFEDLSAPRSLAATAPTRRPGRCAAMARSPGVRASAALAFTGRVGRGD